MNLFISVRDNKGNGNFLPGRINVRLATGTKSSDEAFDDKFTDNGGNLAFVGVDAVVDRYFPSETGKGFTVHVNYRDVNSGWGNKSQFVEKLDAGVTTVVISKLGNGTLTCPSRFNKMEFSNWFKTIVQNAGLTSAGVGPEFDSNGVNAPNLRKLEPELTKCGMIWQHFSNGNLRPRIHWTQNPYDHDIDVGDWNEPWILTFRF